MLLLEINIIYEYEEWFKESFGSHPNLILSVPKINLTVLKALLDTRELGIGELELENGTIVSIEILTLIEYINAKVIN